jgi:NAD(P)-dependent dehydrogenase (short-subunit alcohol dehydrogenase family)
MLEINFTDKVAIITGAGFGLGRDYAIELAKRGAKVLVNDLGCARDGSGIDQKKANKVVEEIIGLGGEAVPNYDNVATLEGGENIVNAAIDVFGKVDILINNAGIIKDHSFIKMEEKDWDAVSNVHLKGVYYVTRPAFKKMRENRYGRIVMTSSGAGLYGNFGQTNYAAAKMGVIGLINVLKLEGEKYNIKVNAIVPSAGTRMSQDAMTLEMFEKLKIEYVTPAVLYLSSEQCRDSGSYINAFGGYFSRSAIMTGAGVTFSDIPTPEQVMGSWDKIKSLDKLKFYNTLPEMVRNIL